MNLYPFIEVERTEQRNVKRTCDLLKVSRTAYYDWTEHLPSARSCSNAVLLEKVREVHKTSKGTYGAPRAHRQLLDDGEVCGHNRVAHLMRTNSLFGRAPRRFRRTTIPNPDATTLTVDLVKRIVGPASIELDTVYCGDITYIRTWEGWLYLATVIDVASRRVVGWAMANHMRTELVSDALSMAINQRHPGAGLIFHSDRGCQYTSDEFGELLDQHGPDSRFRVQVSAGITPWRRASSQHLRPSSSTCTRGRRERWREARSSSSSRDGTTAPGCIRRWVICPQ